MKYISTDNAPKAIGPYSQAVVSNGLVFCTGQIALDTAGNIVESDIKVQTCQVIENIKAILASVDLTLNDVVKTTVFVADMRDFVLVNEVYQQEFGQHKPARTTAEVSALPLGVKISIEIIATLNCDE